MRKMVLAALAATMLCGSGNAATYYFTITGVNGGSQNAQFTLDSQPVVSSYSFNEFGINNVSGYFQFVPGYTTSSANIFFYTSPDGSYEYRDSTGFGRGAYGAPLFTGLTNAPTFLTGQFNQSGSRNGSTDEIVVISATGFTAPTVPEAASWAMMVVGFGLVGAAMRRRESATRFA